MDYVIIAVLEHEIEASLLEAVLQDQGIPYRLRSYRDIAYDGLFQASLGWGVIYADAANREEILAILADIRKPQEDS
ncbi:MAG: hypothetical protein K0Q77_1914 [Anaerosporomusa subterranea]|jgi:hypothetical protein|nr:hypothetical protein [Anaerosporomusa subterranea]